MRTWKLLAAVLAAGAIILLNGSPATAHDELIASTPESGQRLADAPASVSLTFSDEVLTIGAAVVVVDQSGQDWVIGEPVIIEGIVTAALDDRLPSDGGFEIRWRVVSGDGHPISGIIPFTTGDGEPVVRPSDAAGQSAGADSTTSPGAQGDSVLRPVILGVLGAALALAVFSLVQFLLRRRRRGAADDARQDSASAPDLERHSP